MKIDTNNAYVKQVLRLDRDTGATRGSERRTARALATPLQPRRLTENAMCENKIGVTKTRPPYHIRISFLVMYYYEMFGCCDLFTTEVTLLPAVTFK